MTEAERIEHRVMKMILTKQALTHLCARLL